MSLMSLRRLMTPTSLFAATALVTSLSSTPAHGDDDLSFDYPLIDESIAAALALGNDVSQKLPVLFLGKGGANFGGVRDDTNRTNHFSQHQSNQRTSGFSVELYTPYAWLAKVARSSAQTGVPMLPSHIDGGLRLPLMRIVCYADAPEVVREGVYGNPVESVVLLPADKKRPEQIVPVETARVSDKYMTPSGDSVDVGPLVASFQLSDIADLSSLDKKGEFYVRIIAADGEEEDFKIKNKHFKHLP